MDKLLVVFQKYMWCQKCTTPFAKCNNDHEYLVDTDGVLSALFELRSQLRNRNVPLEVIPGNETMSRLLDPEEVVVYWRQFKELFPKDMEQLWTGLEYGLKQYLVVLRERESLFDECELLRQQNNELVRLLHNYK